MMLQSGLSMIMNVDYLIGRYRVVLGRESRPKTVFDHTELGDEVTGLYKNLRGYLMCCQDIIYHRSDIGGFGGQDVRIILYEIKIDGWQTFTVVLTCKVCIRL